MLITRAGRNTTAEALYCGIPTAVIPIVADPHRRTEQATNAAVAATRPQAVTVDDWRDDTALRLALTATLAHTRRDARRRGRHGNAAAAAFITRLLADTDRVMSPAPSAIDRTLEYL